MAEDLSARKLTGKMLAAVIFGLAIWNLIVSLMDNVITPWLGTILSQNSGLPASFTRNYDYPDLFIAVVEFCLAGIVAVTLNWFFDRPARSAVRKLQPITPAVAPVAAPAQRAQVAVPQPPAAPVRVEVPPPPPSVPISTTTAAEYWVPPVAPPPAPIKAQVAAAPDIQRVSLAAPVMRPPAPPVPPPPTPVVEKPVVTPVTAPQPAAVKPQAPVPIKPEVTKPKKEKQVYYNIVGEPISSDED